MLKARYLIGFVLISALFASPLALAEDDDNAAPVKADKPAANAVKDLKSEEEEEEKDKAAMQAELDAQKAAGGKNAPANVTDEDLKAQEKQDTVQDQTQKDDAKTQTTVKGEDPKVLEERDKLLEQAQKGDANAQVILATGYYKGLYGLQKNEAESVNWFLKAADQGNPAAELNLAGAYFHGIGGLKQDSVQALVMVKLMIDQDNPIAKRLNDQAVQAVEKIEKSMTAEQIAQAKLLTDKWVKDHSYLPKEFLPQ